MKKFLALVLLGFSLPAGAETVSAVSFNPTRLGDFEYLKVSKQINLLGGLEATGTRGEGYPGLEIASNGSKGGSVTMDINSASIVTVNQAIARKVDMPETRFQGGDENTALHGSYDAASNSPHPETEFPVTGVLLGKEGKVNVQFTQDSFAKLLQDPDQMVRVFAQKLSVLSGSSQVLNVVGETAGRSSNSGVSLADSTSNSFAKTNGFRLGGVDIPYPGPNTLEGNGTFSLKLSDSGCKLKWVDRQRNTLNESDRPIKVLAFDNCSKSGVSWVPQSNGNCGGSWANMGYPTDWNNHCYAYHCNCTLNAGECTSSNIGTVKTVYQIGECNDDEHNQFGTPLVCNITATVYKCATH